MYFNKEGFQKNKQLYTKIQTDLVFLKLNITRNQKLTFVTFTRINSIDGVSSSETR